MSTMLNFRHGLYKNLPSAKVNGTIYVTTDEKAMYVDLNNERIRLSQIITCTYAEWQALTPPYATEAFYYIIDKNALLKYNEGKPDAGYAAGWVQINSTAALEKEISDLKERVDALDGPNGKIATIETNVATLRGEMDGLIGDNGTIAGINSEIGGLKEKDGKIDESLAALDKKITDGLAAVGSNETVKQLSADMALVKAALSDDDNELIPVSDVKATADQAKSTADTAVQTETFNTFKTENTAAIDAAKNAAITAANNALNEYKGTNDAAVAGVKTRLDNLEGAGYVKKDGTVAMEGNLNVGSHKIINVAAPEADGDAANKGYVDAQDKKIAGTNEDGSLYVAQTVKSAYAAAEAAAAAASAAQDTADGKVDANYVTGALAPYAKSDDVSKEIDADVLAAKNAILGEENSTKTVAGAYSAAASAKSVAEGKASMADVEAKGYAVATEVEATYAKKNDVTKEIDDDVAAATTAILGEANYKQTVKSAYEKAEAALADSVTKVTAQQVKDEIDSRNYTTMNAVEAKGYATTTQAEGYANAVLGTAADVAGTATVHGALNKAVANAADISAMTKDATIKTFKGLEDAISALETEVTTNMQAADAMTFEGTVDGTDKVLPTSGVNKGDTYKATKDFILGDKMVYIGDLLIATGEEGEDGTIANPTWEHVPSGYRADYVPAFSLTNAADGDDADAFDDDKKVTLNLTSAHAAEGTVGDLGAIDFMVDGDSALTISAVNTADKKASLTIGMAWGTF